MQSSNTNLNKNTLRLSVQDDDHKQFFWFLKIIKLTDILASNHQSSNKRLLILVPNVFKFLVYQQIRGVLIMFRIIMIFIIERIMYTIDFFSLVVRIWITTFKIKIPLFTRY
jgi:hypothetical protein